MRDDGELDEALRLRLRALADDELEGAPPVTPVTAAMPGVVGFVQARRRRRSSMAGALAVGLAAAAVLLWWRGRSEGVPACEGFEPVLAARVSADEDERSLALGRRGTLWTEAGTRLVVSAPSTCETRVELLEGAVHVHAADLGGGALVVMAGETTARVLGTRFTVRRVGAAQSVEVQEGRVEVRRGAEVLAVGAGERWDGAIASAAPSARPPGRPDPLPSERAAPEEPAPEPREPAPEPREPAPETEEPTPQTEERPAVPSPAHARELATEADRAWRRGDVEEARALLRRAARAPGPAGDAARIRHARLELGAGSPVRALALLDRPVRSASLRPAALWLEVEAAAAAGDPTRARRAARVLVREFPESAQAGLARARWEDE